MKRPKRRIETEKDEGAGGGDKAWNLGKKSSSFLFPLSSLRPAELDKTYGKRVDRNVKNGKDFSKKGKNKGAGGGEKAGNSKKQSYKQQDSQSSKVSEEPKKAEGEVLLEEALKAHANKKIPAKK